ncbi:hypothetical protein B0T14DRAFT_438807 [Immersiella caudata]|uniref:Sugar phosphate phosphatase n=1 Tax=Immersiella caudata TaxID=314043 RepID=A0AA39WE12_9PEZI|nr:hypothetical protein B0T14DRAFT_438807 [Immersiella caudata]
MPSVTLVCPREVRTSEEGSMARETALTRWPKIVQSMMGDTEKTLRLELQSELADERGRIQNALRSLKEDILRDRPLRQLSFLFSLMPLQSDGRPDIDNFNTKLASFGRSITWHKCPWLFAECHPYRSALTQISRRSMFLVWQTHDIFARQKLNALVASHAAVEELYERYLSLANSGAFATTTTTTTTTTTEAKQHLFFEMTEVALWSNATDLSLPGSTKLDQISALQGTKAIQAGQARIISNDMAAAWGHLQSSPSKGRPDIVLDNAGFELFTDLVYTLYLLGAGFASTIKLHVKSIPWFVSNVMPHDMDVLLSTLADAAVFPGASARAVAALLRRAYQDGRLTVEEHPFWTTGSDFQEMPISAPDLLESLRASTLVVFKGDLNYRKLVRDSKWPHTTSFKQAIKVLGRTGIKILALRTKKADLCVGLDEQTLGRVEREAPKKAWVRSGKYAVASFSNGLP